MIYALTFLALACVAEGVLIYRLYWKQEKNEDFCVELFAKTGKRAAEITEEVNELKDRMTDFEKAGLENLKAQTEAERAFAEGVQNIVGFGAAVPTLNTKVFDA